jgi:hypothetical protein
MPAGEVLTQDHEISKDLTTSVHSSDDQGRDPISSVGASSIEVVGNVLT